jgi:hypothetical protein
MDQCQICLGTYSKLVTHHIQSKSKGGSNKKNNIINICVSCHDLIHNAKLIVEKKVLTTAGMKVIWRLPETETITGCLPQVYIYDERKK